MKAIINKYVLSVAMYLSAVGACAQLTNEQWRDSLSVLNKQIMTSPYNTDLYLRKAAVNLELEQWDYAIETYSDVLLKDPKNPAALFYRAFANSKMRRYDLARIDYEDFLEEIPESVEGRLGLAYILGKMDRKKEAMDTYNQLVEGHPDEPLVYAARAGYEAEEKYYDLAIYDWDKAIELAPDNYNFLVSKADVLITMYELDEAKQCLDLAVKKGAPRGELRGLYEKCKY